MSFLQSIRSLPPNVRIGVGVAFLVWGTAGLYLTDSAEKKFGFEATQSDREALEAAVPKFTLVDREEVDKKRSG